MKKLFSILLICLFLSSMLLIPKASPTTYGFSAAANMSSGEERSMVRISNGTWYYVVDYTTTNRIYRSLDNGSDSTFIVNLGGINSCLATDSNDVVHCVYTDDGNIWYINSTDWSKREIYNPISTVDGYGSSSMTVDGNDMIHIIFELGTSGDSNDNQLFYMNSTDSGNIWSSSQMLTNEPDLGDDFFDGCIVSNATNAIHIIHYWEDRSDTGKTQIVDTWSTDYINWVTDNLTDTDEEIWSGFSHAPSAMVDDNNIIHVAAHNYSAIQKANITYFYNDSGQGWVQEWVQPFAGETNSGKVSISTTGNGTKYIFSQGINGIQYSVNWSGSNSWSVLQNETNWDFLLSPSSLGSYYPIIDGNHINRPATGFSFVSRNTTCSWIYVITNNLSWDSISATNIFPVNGSIDISQQPSLFADVSSSDSYVNITWWSNSSGTWLQFGNNDTIISGTNVTQQNLNFTNYDTTYYWKINVTDDSTSKSFVHSLTTIPAPVPELDDISEPSSGIEGTTIFYFNVSYKINDSDPPETVNVNITQGIWYDNSSLVWYEGGNGTWANYTYNTTLSNLGTYNYLFFVDSGNQTNTTTSDSVVVTTDSWLSLYFPSYVELGDYIMATGSVENSTGTPLDDTWIYTQFYNSTGDSQLSSPLRLMCENGAYWLTITSTIFIPNNYTIWVNFTDPDTGIDYNSSHDIYIGQSGGPGHYSTPVYFTFYNNNTGIGLSRESFKVYVNTTSTLSSTDRVYGDAYNSYTGETIYYRIDDYFDLQVYPTSGTSTSVTISEVNEFIDIPIDWYSFGIQNMNHSVIKATLTNGSRTYVQYLFPYEQYYWDLLSGDYNLTKEYYEPASETLQKTEYTDITITNDTYYWIAGYSRQDIICDVNDIENRSVLLLSFYNTNDGLGLPDETLKIYLDGTRYKDNIFYVQNGTIVNVTIKDYYNQTMYWGNHSIVSDYMFLDLGLTFHSYKFSNANNIYYTVSILKSNATRWWEVGVCPYETIEFLLPSGYNYTIRVYDASNDELCNFTTNVTNSKLFLINGSSLDGVLSGQSNITGQLLELQVELGIATQPDIVAVGYNIPFVYSLFDRHGQILGDNVIKICPAQILMATTYNETWSNNTISPLIPDNTTANGSIMLQSLDRIWFHGGNSTYVNVSHSNGTLIQNTSYIPNFYDPIGGAPITITSSHNLSLSRESRFQQIKKFYWTKYVDQGKYTATLNFTNPCDTTLKEVFLFIEFANDTTPDYNTVEVYDVTNGVYLREGEHFDASSTGVHLALTSITSLSQRLFTIIYYQGEDVKQPSDAIVVLDDWGSMKTYDNKNYYYLKGQWINTRDDTFLGPLYIQFNFSSEFDVARESVVVYDVEKVKYLERNEFVYQESGIVISQESVGEVGPQAARTFEIYYLHISEDTIEDKMLQSAQNFMDDPIFKLPGVGNFLGVHLIVVILLTIGLISVAGAKNYKDNLWVLVMCLFFIFLAVMSYLQPMG